MTQRPQTVLLLILLASTLCAQRGRDQGPPAELKNFTFKDMKFDSKALGVKASYGVFLPKGYDDEKMKDTRYPLVVWLHGMYEDHLRFMQRGGAEVLDAAAGKAEIPDVVFVTANGGRTSFFMNGKESGNYEDLVIKDLLAEVDSKFRVAKGREQRVLMGVSMGGGAALRIAFKHPELFGTVATHSAALFPIDPNDLPQRQRDILFGESAQGFGLSKIFGVPPDLEMWKKENVLHLAASFTPDSLQGMRVYFDCGDKDRYGFHTPNAALDKLLTEHKVKHTWRSVPDGNHGSRFVQQNLDESLKFVTASLGAAAGKAGLEDLLAPGADKRSGGDSGDKKKGPPASQPSHGK
jgi:putative tributyrin esterase